MRVSESRSDPPCSRIFLEVLGKNFSEKKICRILSIFFEKIIAKNECNRGVQQRSATEECNRGVKLRSGSYRIPYSLQ